MLYRFKCKAAGDVVMLEENGRQLLEILGKDPAAPGILLVDQMPAAEQALRDAALVEQQEFERRKAEAEAQGLVFDETLRISLKTRVAPFIEMMQHAQRESTEIVWGV